MAVTRRGQTETNHFLLEDFGGEDQLHLIITGYCTTGSAIVLVLGLSLNIISYCFLFLLLWCSYRLDCYSSFLKWRNATSWVQFFFWNTPYVARKLLQFYYRHWKLMKDKFFLGKNILNDPILQCDMRAYKLDYDKQVILC